MMYPPLDELIKHVDSRYTLVVAAAKRARQILEITDPDAVEKTRKPVTIALEEINDGFLKYERPKGGIK
ncbi:MAG: DNA-directed RNA polymerase subunit omega [Patescibacteria group bacterium]